MTDCAIFSGFSTGRKFVYFAPLTGLFRRGSGHGIFRIIFEKGVDFLGKVRYNLFLHKGHSMPGSNFREQEV
jgi:hypothetical protein